MKNSFNVLVWDINRDELIHYDIIPYLLRQYNETKKMDSYKETPKTRDEFKEFIKKEAMYQWWSRCEYEIIISDWPCQKHQVKIDVYDQVLMNLDVITDIIINIVKNEHEQ